jgi:flagellar biosynthetic protein FlhB
MAEDIGDKTEAPTPRRRQEAREQGNIARSPDLTAAVLLLGMLMLLDWYGPGLVGALRLLLEQMLSLPALADNDVRGIGPTILRSALQVGGALAPVLAGVLVLAVGVNLAQVGLFFNSKRLQPRLEALNPLKGLGRIFRRSQTGVQLAMSVTKLLLVAAVAYSAVHERAAHIVAVQQLSLIQVFGLAAQLIYAIGIRIGVVLLVLAIIDYAYQRWRVERELRMTRHEIKEELKRMEGDPQIRGRRRQIQMHLAAQRLHRDVPSADVVVTNPTEFAIALRYDAATMRAPRVVAKGQGFLAQRIREIAVTSGVPILERKPLARALYKLVEVGQEIPEQFYAAVAEILAYVYELTGKVRRPAAVERRRASAVMGTAAAMGR